MAHITKQGIRGPFMLAFSTRPQCLEAEYLSQGSPRTAQGETAFGLLPAGAQPFQNSPGHCPGTGPAGAEEACLLWGLANFFHLPKEPCPGPARRAVFPFFLTRFLLISQGILEQEFMTLGTFSLKALACNTRSKIKVLCVPTSKTFCIAIPAVMVCVCFLS